MFVAVCRVDKFISKKTGIGTEIGTFPFNRGPVNGEIKYGLIMQKKGFAVGMIFP